MTAPGRYAASDGSFAKSAGSAAARGGILIAIAVVIGFALLAWGFDGGDTDAAIGDPGAADGTGDDGGDDGAAADDGGSTDDGTGDTTGDAGDTGDDTGDTGDAGDDTGDAGDTGDDTTTSEAPVLDDPSTIKVAVLNGTGVAGLAGDRAGTLTALNYVALAGNAAGTPVTDSKVYFVTGYGDEAKVVAEAFSAPSSVLEVAPEDPSTLETESQQAESASAHIIVVIGTDEAL